MHDALLRVLWVGFQLLFVLLFLWLLPPRVVFLTCSQIFGFIRFEGIKRKRLFIFDRSYPIEHARPLLIRTPVPGRSLHVNGCWGWFTELWICRAWRSFSLFPQVPTRVCLLTAFILYLGLEQIFFDTFTEERIYPADVCPSDAWRCSPASFRSHMRYFSCGNGGPEMVEKYHFEKQCLMFMLPQAMKVTTSLATTASLVRLVWGGAVTFISELVAFSPRYEFFSSIMSACGTLLLFLITVLMYTTRLESMASTILVGMSVSLITMAGLITRYREDLRYDNSLEARGWRYRHTRRR